MKNTPLKLLIPMKAKIYFTFVIPKRLLKYSIFKCSAYLCIRQNGNVQYRRWDIFSLYNVILPFRPIQALVHLNCIYLCTSIWWSMIFKTNALISKTPFCILRKSYGTLALEASALNSSSRTPNDDHKCLLSQGLQFEIRSKRFNCYLLIQVQYL